MRNVFFAAAALVASTMAIPGAAEAQGYRYHKSCYWTGSGWGYKHHGKVLVCRPHKPHGGGWYWHSDGGKHGWHHKRHGWHHKW